MELTVSSVGFPDPCIPPIHTATHPPTGFDCDVSVGDTFFGTFSLVDTSILTGGISPVAAAIAHFIITVGGYTWAQDFPISGGNDFEGFRVGLYPGSPIFGGTTDVGFEVTGGRISGFALGADVFGEGDASYVDFHVPTVADTYAFDAVIQNSRESIRGTYVLRAVPEPSPLALIALGFVGVGLFRLRRSKQNGERLGPKPNG